MDLPKIQAIAQKLTLNCKGHLVLLDKPAVMGILNVTPDSFFENSRTGGEQLVKKAEQMIAAGATFIDIGGYSSRPNAPDVSPEEEIDRVIPAIELVHKQLPEALISVDTFRAKVAELAVNAGAALVNDISSGDDDGDMMATVARLRVPYIMMHKKGNPRTMNKLADYENVTLEVLDYFSHKIAEAKQAGVVDLILDPGFGFAKNLQHNYELLNNMSDLRVAGLPLLIGVSRKKMIQHVTLTDAAGALNGTTAVNTLALTNGANILRVHDVKEAIECINIVRATHGNFQDL